LKTVWGQPHKGSNPLPSVQRLEITGFQAFSIFIKTRKISIFSAENHTSIIFPDPILESLQKQHLLTSILLSFFRYHSERCSAIQSGFDRYWDSRKETLSSFIYMIINTARASQ